MSRVFVASDPHFGHESMAIKRGFSGAEEHDELIIKNWNAVVSKRDTVYLLGDITMETSKHYHQLTRLNGLIRNKMDEIYFKKIGEVAPLNTWVYVNSPTQFRNIHIPEKMKFIDNYTRFYVGNDRGDTWLCMDRSREAAADFKKLYIALSGKTPIEPELAKVTFPKLKNHPRIHDLAVRRTPSIISGETNLSSAFTWLETPEGSSFWYKIDEGEFHVFYDKFGGDNPDKVEGRPYFPDSKGLFIPKKFTLYSGTPTKKDDLEVALEGLEVKTLTVF
jgi:hypothetical protein